MRTLFVLLICLATNLLAETITCRIEAFTTGVYTGKRFISCKVSEPIRFVEYSIDPNIEDVKYDTLLAIVEDAYTKGKLMVIEFDDGKNIISMQQVPKKRIVKKFERSIIKSWKKPTGSHDAYNVGDSVIYGGKYVSLINGNIWAPDEATNYWKLKNPNSKKGHAPFKKPTGAHDCYMIGDAVFYNGLFYESLINGNVWSPEEYPRGWKFTGGYGPNPSSPYHDSLAPLPAPASASSASAYTHPTGAHDAYKTGDVVTYNDKTYRSKVDANVWAPDVAINFWELTSGEEEIKEWRKPTGIVDCYHIGNKVIFNGQTWESTINSNVWSPEEFAQGWKEIL